jgi:hypothetical protein
MNPTEIKNHFAKQVGPIDGIDIDWDSWRRRFIVHLDTPKGWFVVETQSVETTDTPHEVLLSGKPRLMTAAEVEAYTAPPKADPGPEPERCEHCGQEIDSW